MKKFLRCNGYILVYKPNHERAFTKGEAERNGLAGYVYEHIFVAERKLKRKLEDNEVVHHIDFDRSNNCWPNLLVLDRGMHAKLHSGLERNFGLIENNKSHKHRTYTKIPRCIICRFPLSSKLKVTCSKTCHNKHVKSTRIINVGRRKLHSLLSRHPWIKVANHFGVSDNGLRKHAKRIGLNPKYYRNGSFVGPRKAIPI